MLFFSFFHKKEEFKASDLGFRRHSRFQFTCCLTGMAVRLQGVARMAGADVGALGIDAGVTARLTTRPLALIHILTAPCMVLEAWLTSADLTEVRRH